MNEDFGLQVCNITFHIAYIVSCGDKNDERF